MGAIQVKDVPAELHEALRARAREEGMPLSDYLLRLIRRDLRTPSRHAWLARVKQRPPSDDVDVLGALNEEREDRETS